jgi:hypothetical protein
MVNVGGKKGRGGVGARAARLKEAVCASRARRWQRKETARHWKNRKQQRTRVSM